MQCYRERQLEPPGEEEEIEEIEEHEEPEQPMESEKITDSSQKDGDADKETDGEDKEKEDGNESDGSRKSGRTSRSRSRSVSSKWENIVFLNSLFKATFVNYYFTIFFLQEHHPVLAHIHALTLDLDRVVVVLHQIEAVRVEAEVVR